MLDPHYQKRVTESFMQNEARRIVYDPVSWVHPQRFSLPDKFNSVRCRSVFNDILIAHFKLSVGDINLECSMERYLAYHWSLLSKAAFMMVCQRYRASLAYNGQLVKLDSATRQFAMLDIVGSNDKLRGDITISELEYMAGQEMAIFGSSLSTIMRERLPLLFPEKKSVRDLRPGPPDMNELLLRLAIQHAKRNH